MTKFNKTIKQSSKDNCNLEMVSEFLIPTRTLEFRAQKNSCEVKL